MRQIKGIFLRTDRSVVCSTMLLFSEAVTLSFAFSVPLGFINGPNTQFIRVSHSTAFSGVNASQHCAQLCTSAVRSGRQEHSKGQTQSFECNSRNKLCSVRLIRGNCHVHRISNRPGLGVVNN